MTTWNDTHTHATAIGGLVTTETTTYLRTYVDTNCVTEITAPLLFVSGVNGRYLTNIKIDTTQTTTGGASRTITQPSGWTSGWACWVYK
jgi:hypothetical protein